MAKLGDITIRNAECYRPCYVNGKKALFHRWEEIADVVFLAGDNPTGQVKYTVAIVEFEDGTVAGVHTDKVRFVPGLMNEYDFREAVMNETRNDVDSGE